MYKEKNISGIKGYECAVMTHESYKTLLPIPLSNVSVVEQIFQYFSILLTDVQY